MDDSTIIGIDLSKRAMQACVVDWGGPEARGRNAPLRRSRFQKHRRHLVLERASPGSTMFPVAETGDDRTLPATKSMNARTLAGGKWREG